MTSTLSPELRERLSNVAVATLSAQLMKRGYKNITIDGVHPLVPGTKIVGTARTLRFVAHRPDLAKQRGGGYNAHKRAIDTLNEGDVLVIEARGYPYAGTLGDVLALRAKMCGAAGIVTDGAIRDGAEIAKLGIPVCTPTTHPYPNGRVHIPWDNDVAITCGGAPVCVGDVVVADDDGALVFPIDLAEELVEACEKQELMETFVAEMIAQGEPLDGLFPLTDKWNEPFEQWKANR